MADLNLQKVDLSPIKAIAHDGVSLNVLIERNGGYCLESLPAPEQAFQSFQNSLSSLLSFNNSPTAWPLVHSF